MAPLQVPIYDFRTSTRTGYRDQPVPESRVVIIEGIYALSERLRPMLDLRVSVAGARRCAERPVCWRGCICVCGGGVHERMRA